MRLLVCGSAHHVYRDLVCLELQRLHAAHRITVLVHGGLGGVCAAAEDWARQADVSIVRYPPNWVCHRKRAEAVRNRFMLHDARPDMVSGFPRRSAHRRPGAMRFRGGTRRLHRARARFSTRPREHACIEPLTRQNMSGAIGTGSHTRPRRAVDRILIWNRKL